eukprot:s413_g23.t1
MPSMPPRIAEECELLGSCHHATTVASVANAANSTTGSYLKEVNRTTTAFLLRRDAVDRDDAIANLSEQVTIKGRLCLVLGGKNLGKTLLKEKAIARCKAKVNILSVDMRDADMLGKDLMTALDLQRQKSLGWARLLVQLLCAVIRFPVDYALKRTSGFSEAGAAAQEVLSAAISDHQISINNFISQSRKIPRIIIDEANAAIPGIAAGDGSWISSTSHHEVDQADKSSECDHGIFRLGLSVSSASKRLIALSTISKVIVIGEVPLKG